MKSFGARFAAGAITILFGAYAAALAQKDKQNSSDSWAAEVPSLGEPAEPIADIGGDSWLSQPSTNLQEAASQLAGSIAPSSPVQLVQHTEPIGDDAGSEGSPAPFDPSEFTATLGEPAPAESSNAAGTDWTLPPNGNAAVATTTDGGPAMGMTLPPAGARQNEAPSGASLPELSLGVAPTMDFGNAALAAGEPISENQNPIAAPPQAVVDNGQPANLLRGAESAQNALRAESDTPGAMNLAELAESTFPPRPNNDVAAEPARIENNVGLAQNAPGFGLSAQQFDQPIDGPRAGLGSPQPSAFPQPGMNDVSPSSAQSFAGAPAIGGSPGVNPNPSFTAPPLRTASLPGAPNPVPQYPNQQYPNQQYPDQRYPNQQNPGGYQPTTLDAPPSAVAVNPDATIDSPGDRRLEGIQTPSVVIQKRAPSEVKVGKPASFVIHVQNAGTVEALDVEVHDRIPAGMRLIDASPRPTQQGNVLLWQLGAMPAGDERTITMQLVPEQEGELGSVARVSFEAAASVRTMSTRPALKIVQTAPDTVLIGQQLEIELVVSNPGSGEATGVVLQEDVPEGLEHPKGRQLDNGMGTLAAGEVRNQVLRLRAVAPGFVQNTIRLTGDDGLTAEHTVEVQVIAPDLKVDLSGPSRRFLERQATYQLNIANEGTADATNIELAVQLDRGFTFVSTDYEGQYDASRHAVYWSLAQLPAGGKGSVPLTLLPVEEGEQAIVIDARADLGVVAKNERKMTVEGFAELSFAITNPGGPIELGSDTSYQIVVTNSGSKPDTNVLVQLQLPPGLELVSADSEAGTDGRGLVRFQPKSSLSPNEEIKYGLRLRGTAPGTHLVRAIVVSDHSSVPVTKEESTLVYADQ